MINLFSSLFYVAMKRCLQYIYNRTSQSDNILEVWLPKVQAHQKSPAGASGHTALSVE